MPNRCSPSLFQVPNAGSAPWLSAICDKLAPAALRFTVREVVHTAWALARLSAPHAPLLDALSDRLAGGAARTLAPLGVSHAAVIGWAFVRLRRHDRRVLRVVEKVSGLTGHRLMRHLMCASLVRVGGSDGRTPRVVAIAGVTYERCCSATRNCVSACAVPSKIHRATHLPGLDTHAKGPETHAGFSHVCASPPDH